MKTASEDGVSADLMKRTWDLPPYKSPQFMQDFPDLDAFRQSPAYQYAVEAGLIVNDRWTGPISDEENEEAFAEEFQAALRAAAIEEGMADMKYDAKQDIEDDGE